jgi:hypothetical protein
MERGVLVLGDPFLESVEVEFIFDVFFVDFAEEDVVLEAAEPLDPANVDVFAELRFLAHLNYLYLN